IGELVGRLFTRDPDTFDIHSYQLVSGTGDDDNSKFMILGDLLMAAQKFDFEDINQFKIRIRSTDKAMNIIEKEFLITIIDVDETVGIATNETGLRIYPNPFRESASIHFPNPGQDDYTLRIIDLAGKTVFLKQSITEDRFTLYRNNLGKGYYLLLLQGKQNYREKLIIE
ncbi:T9SS type A sorting domain-containing protein, partial [Bacteroidota bacterium]